MEIDAQDVINILADQRNKAHDEVAQYKAAFEKSQRRVAELEKELASKQDTLPPA